MGHTGTGPTTSTGGIEALLAACRDRTLERDQWTHEAHLTVAWALLREVGDPATTLGELRGMITAYNATSGLPADRVICHETITRYYLGAILAIDADRPEVLTRHPWCDRRAPLRHWRYTTLTGERAKRTWVEPDLAPLPWSDPPTRGADR